MLNSNTEHINITLNIERGAKISGKYIPFFYFHHLHQSYFIKQQIGSFLDLKAFPAKYFSYNCHDFKLCLSFKKPQEDKFQCWNRSYNLTNRGSRRNSGQNLHQFIPLIPIHDILNSIPPKYQTTQYSFYKIKNK